jgi:hypothetical protein
VLSPRLADSAKVGAMGGKKRHKQCPNGARTMTMVMTGRQVALAGACHDYWMQRQASSEAAYRPL